MEQDVRALLQHLRSGHAQGLDVLFQQFKREKDGVYRVARDRYPLVEVDPARLAFPGEPGRPAGMADALEAALPQATGEDGFLTLLERFGGFVAARDPAGAEVGGVSWFDQARLRVALGACGPEVMVLRADVSGIQDFIYGVDSARALKALRARSFYLELLAVHALRQILARCGVSRANVAYLGGGGFQVYLPPEHEREALDFARSFDDWLWMEHQGALGFSVASVRVPVAEARAGAEFQKALSAALALRKARRREGRLAQVFAEVQDPAARQAREETLTDELVEFGALLPRATHIEVRPETEASGRGWVVMDSVAYRPVHVGPAGRLPAERLALNSLSDLGAFPMFTGNYVTRVQDVPAGLRITDPEDPQPDDTRRPATLTQLADLALGQPRLALYRCDADNMGRFFSGGIPGHDAARHATLSRLMSLFFQGYVNALCAQRTPLVPGVPQAERSAQEAHGRYLSIVYSGGDDAVVVGAWNEVLTFAVDLRRAYRRFTGGNPLLGLSGGAFVAKAKYPLRRMADRAHEAETLAKEVREGPEVVKDGFVPFLTMDSPAEDARAAVRWNVFASLDGAQDGIEHTLDILSAFVELRDARATDGHGGLELVTRRAFLWKLQAFADREGDVWRLPMLHYALARATPPEQRQPQWQALKKTLLDPRTWPHLGHVLGFLHLARPAAHERME